jgi:hypothetical protein
MTAEDDDPTDDTPDPYLDPPTRAMLIVPPILPLATWKERARLHFAAYNQECARKLGRRFTLWINPTPPPLPTPPPKGTAPRRR